jgi:hypothetical protein
MKYRKLRIAWSVVWGLFAVLLCVLWAHSYWYRCVYGYRPTVTCTIGIESCQGRSAVTVWSHSPDPWGGKAPASYFRLFGYDSHPITTDPNDWPAYVRTLPLWGRDPFRTRSDMNVVNFPIVIVPSIAACLAALPWIRWSFSLRTLLIATTLIAMLLGLIVWTLGR